MLVDSSAWIEYLRETGSPTHRRVRDALAGGEALATTGPVLMEILAGARDDAHARSLERLLARAEMVPVRTPEDFEAAAAIYRAVRAAGSEVSAQVDCLIAAVAIRSEMPLLHSDADFNAIAAVSPLRAAG